MVMLAGWPSERRGLLARMTTSQEAMRLAAVIACDVRIDGDHLRVGDSQP